MAQEDEILSLHDALLASIEKNENSRSSFGDDDEINDEELTALRFAALISKKSKHRSKPQPISTTVPAVPSAGPTSQNHPVPPAPTISKLAPRTHVPSGTFANPFQGQPFRPFFGHQQDKRTSNLIVIQTHQPHQQRKDKNFNKEHSHPKQETSSGKSALLRPQDKWDKSREETKSSESPKPKVSAKFRRLMSRDSDSDDSDSDDDSDGSRTDPESLFICPEPDERPIASYSDDDDNNENKSVGSVTHSDLDTSDVKCSDRETNEITSDISDHEHSNKTDNVYSAAEIDGDKDRAVADLDVTSPTLHRSVSSSGESSRSRSQSPASSVLSSMESHSVYSRSPSNHSSRSSKSGTLRSPSVHKSPESSSRCHSPVMSLGSKQPSRPASVSRTHISPRSPSSHCALRPHRGLSPSLSPHHSRSSFRSVQRRSRSRSPLYTERYRRSPKHYSRSPSPVHVHHHNRSSPKYSGSPSSHHAHRRRHSRSPDYSPRHNRSQRKCHQSPSHPRLGYAETSRRHSRSPSDACKYNRSPSKCSVSPSSKSCSHRSRSPRRCSSSQRDRHRSYSPKQGRAAHSQSPISHKQKSGWTNENRLRSGEKDYWDKPPTREELSRSTHYKARPVRSDKPKPTNDHQSTRVSAENHQKDQGRSSSVDQGRSHRKAGEKFQKRNGQKGRGHSSDRCSAGLSVSRDHASGSQDKENKCHRNDEKEVPDMKSSLLSQTKKFSLSPEEQAKLEARQRKFASLSEVKVSEPKKISLKDIVRSTEQDKDNSNKDRQLPKRSAHEKVNVDASDPQQDKTGRNGSDREDGKLHKKGNRQSSPSDIRTEKKKKEDGSKKSHQAGVKDSDKKDHRSVHGPVVRSLLSVVTTAKGSRDVSHKHDDRSINLAKNFNREQKSQLTKEKAESRNDTRTESEVEHEDARQIILRMKQQKAKEMNKRPKSPVGENVKKNEKASKVVSPTISVTFSDCQSRLPIYRHLDQSPLKPDRNQELAKNVKIKVRSELHGGVDGQNKCKKSEAIQTKTVDLRDILESRKDGSEMRTGFKRKGRKINPEEDSGEKKKIRLKRPGRLEIRSAVVNATD